jgi:hypothetical protein
MSSVAAVAAEDAIDHGADEGNAIAGASIVAIAGVVASAAVIDRAAAVVAATAAAVIAAGSDNTTATGVASRSTTGGTSHRASTAATSSKGLSAAAAMSGRGLSAATMATILMAGSQRIRRHWHATQRDRGGESDKSFFAKHVILLCFKQTFVCDCADNVDGRQELQGKGTRLRVSLRGALP